MPYRLGFDVGGTFTDFVLQAPSGELATAKRLTTYPDPADACLAGLDALARGAGVAWGDVAQAVHGTTLGSNIVIERKARGVGLLTTRGFRDVLIIGRQKRYQVYDLQIEKPPPLIPRRFIGEVTERILADGTVRTPLDEAAARGAVRALIERGVTTLAICLLHAYLNPTHEQRLARIVAEEAPHVAVTLSHEVSPTFREYERTSTTVVNAYVMSAVRAYLKALQAALADRGYRGRLFVMQSSGGIATAEAMERYPVRMIESGPAAGALMAAAYGELTGYRDLIAFDMGGTTAKICLLDGGTPRITNRLEAARVHRLKRGSGLPLSVPSIDLLEIGAGGGSVARVDRLGLLQVGPDSAGAAPGPACYGRGGTEPTVTDADLLLGYLDPAYFLGGHMPLDVDAARHALGRAVAAPMGVDLLAAAWAVHTTVNAHMANAVRIHCAERGKDPRTLDMIAFGGAGPVHAERLARTLGLRRVVVPFGAGAASGLGFLVAPISFDFSWSHPQLLDDVDRRELAVRYRAMQQAGYDLLTEAGVPDKAAVFERSCDMRYAGQGHEVHVSFGEREPWRLAPTGLRERFEATYLSIYGRSHAQAQVEAVTWRLLARGPRPEVRLQHAAGAAPADGSGAHRGHRPAYAPELGGMGPFAVHDRRRLRPGDRLAGPAIVEERESTAVVGPGATAVVDGDLNLLITPPREVGT